MTLKPTRARRKASLLLLVSALSRAPAASAQEVAAPPAISVAPVGCADLDIEETERLLRVELAVVAARAERPRAPSVTIACSNSTLHIDITDPVSKTTRALDFPAPERSPGRERTVALAASQLFLSSWLEMIVRDRPTEARTTRPVATDKPLGPSPAPRAPHARYELSLGAGAKARALSRPFSTAGFELRGVRAFADRWLLGARAAGEMGAAERSSGSIRGVAFAVGALGGLRFSSDPWGFDTGACLSLDVLHGSGEPHTSSTVATSATGAAAELALLAGPTLRLPPFRLALSAEAGLLEPTVTFRSAHDSAVHWDGLWLGGAFLVGIELGS